MRKEIDMLGAAGALVYACLLGAVIAIVPEVPMIIRSIIGVSFFVGLCLDYRWHARQIVSPPLLVLLVIVSIVPCLMGITEGNFFGRVLSILLIIVSAKLVAPKKTRDMLQLYLLNLLIVAAASATRWGLEFALLVVFESFFSLTGLLFLCGAGEQAAISMAQAKRLVRWSGVITLCLIPTTVMFFLIMPRPSWALFAWGAKGAARSGFSDEVSPGAVEQIKIDRSPAFRATWLSGPPPKSPMWRGIVYDSYQGGVWQKRYKDRVDIPDFAGEYSYYEVLFEPTETRYLPSLDVPAHVSLKSMRPSVVNGYTIQISKSLRNRTLYRVRSMAVGHIPADLHPDAYLEIPEGIRQRLDLLAKDLLGKTDLKTAQAIASFLRTNYAYDLSPGRPVGDPVLHFLFSNKRGHCEYYASAMVLLLRTLGIPARVVAGYLGGEWNEMGRYFLVRQSDAHTWVETFVQGKGWVSFDPTPSVAQASGFRLARKLGRVVDYLRLKWYYWVLEYDFGRQVRLARKAAALFRSIGRGEIKLDLTIPSQRLASFLPLLLLPLGFLLFRLHWMWLRNRPKTAGERFVYLLQKYGYEKQASETLREFAGRIRDNSPEVGRQALDFVEEYYLVEYGGQDRENRIEQGLSELRICLKASIGNMTREAMAR